MPIRRAVGDDAILTMVYEGEFSQAEFEDALAWSVAELEKARAAGRKRGLLSIAMPDTKMDSRQRSYSAAWLQENAEILRATCVGHAVVVSNPIQRGILTAILWLGEYAVPIRAYGSEADARRWLGGHAALNAALGRG